MRQYPNGSNIPQENPIDLPIYFRENELPVYLIKRGPKESVPVMFSFSPALPYAGGYDDLTYMLGKPHMLGEPGLPARIRVADTSWLVTEGFLAEFDETNDQLEPMFLQMKMDEDIVTVVNHKVYSDVKYSEISKIVDKLLTDIEDYTVSKKPLKMLGDFAEIPKFNSIGEKKAFMDDILNDVLGSL